MEDYNPFALLEPTPLLDTVIEMNRLHDELDRQIDWSKGEALESQYGMLLGHACDKEGRGWFLFLSMANKEPRMYNIMSEYTLPDGLDHKASFTGRPEFEIAVSTVILKRFKF